MTVVVDYQQRNRPTHGQQRPDRQQTAAKTSGPGADQPDGVRSEETSQIGQRIDDRDAGGRRSLCQHLGSGGPERAIHRERAHKSYAEKDDVRGGRSRVGRAA